MGLVNKETDKSVSAFVNSIKDDNQREDTKKLIKIIRDITGKRAKIWGDNFFIGFGKYKYNRKGSKEEHEWFNVGFAPRKDKITLYLTCYLDKEPLVKELGKVKHGKGCLYIKSLDDVDCSVLKKLIKKYKDGRWYA